MKVFTLTLFIAGLCSFNCNAQVNPNLKQNPKLELPATQPDNPVILKDWLLKGKLNRLETSSLSLPQTTEDNIEPFVDERSVAPRSMPIVVPEGSFPMKVHKPDSTIDYTIRVKKF
ncbi:MAG: hypothetical protein AAFN93_07990 [Bacteroidota bacterium]